MLDVGQDGFELWHELFQESKDCGRIMPHFVRHKYHALVADLLVF